MSGKPQDSQPPPYRMSNHVTTTLPPPISHPPNNTHNGCCGCSSKVWASVIAGLQIFFAVINIIQAFVAMGSTRDSTSRLEEYESSFDFDPKYSAVQGFATLALGLILAAGIHYKKQTLFVIWLVVWGLQIGIGTIILFIVSLSMFGSAGFKFPIGGLAMIMILVSCFRIVNHHRKELEDEDIQNQSNQIVQLSSVQVQGNTSTNWNQ